MNTSALPPTTAAPAPRAPGGAGTPTAPDRVPARAAPVRAFADMLRHQRADASRPAEVPTLAAPSSADASGPESEEPLETTPEKNSAPAKAKSRAAAPARSPAASDQGIRDSEAVAETRAMEERAAEPVTDRATPAVDPGGIRPLPIVEQKAARAWLGAAELAPKDADATTGLAFAADSENPAARRAPGLAGDARAGRRDDAGRTAAVEIAATTAQSASANIAGPRPQEAAAARPAFDLALHAASQASAVSLPIASGESMRSDAATPTLALPTPVDSPEFAAALGVQVSLLARGGVQQAELHLNPAEMGPVSIRIRLDGTEAQVQFGADLAQTREAIESGLPELASALREAGFTLAGGGVSQHAGQRSRDDGSASTAPTTAGQATDAPAAVEHALQAVRRVAAGGVDLYA